MRWEFFLRITILTGVIFSPLATAAISKCIPEILVKLGQTKIKHRNLETEYNTEKDRPDLLNRMMTLLNRINSRDSDAQIVVFSIASPI